MEKHFTHKQLETAEDWQWEEVWGIWEQLELWKGKKDPETM